MMRSQVALALASVALLAFGACACGSSRTTTTSPVKHSTGASTSNTTAQKPSPPSFLAKRYFTKTDADKDDDIGAPYDDTNHRFLLNYGRPANASDTRVITGLIKRYYAAATAEDGEKACPMLYSTLAEAVPEDDGQSPPGQPYEKGTTCPAVLHGLFNHFHHQLAVKFPKLSVSRVRIDERHARVMLTFGKMPEREMSVTREGRNWKIETLLDNELP